LTLLYLLFVPENAIFALPILNLAQEGQHYPNQVAKNNPANPRWQIVPRVLA